jgi:tetratricopeptide (TPR) repeat protein
MNSPGFILVLVIIGILAMIWILYRQQAERNQARNTVNLLTKVNVFATKLPKNPYEAEVVKNSMKLERYPNNATYYCDRGASYLMLQKFDDALHDFNQAIHLKPDYADAFSNRGLVYYSQERYKDALADYNRAIEIRPNDPVYFLNRGQVYRRLGEYEQALADINRTLELQPNVPDAIKERGLVYYAMGNKDKARTELSAYRTMLGYIMFDAEAIRALMDLEKQS